MCTSYRSETLFYTNHLYECHMIQGHIGRYMKLDFGAHLVVTLLGKLECYVNSCD